MTCSMPLCLTVAASLPMCHVPSFAQVLSQETNKLHTTGVLIPLERTVIGFDGVTRDSTRLKLSISYSAVIRRDSIEPGGGSTVSGSGTSSEARRATSSGLRVNPSPAIAACVNRSCIAAIRSDMFRLADFEERVCCNLRCFGVFPSVNQPAFFGHSAIAFFHELYSFQECCNALLFGSGCCVHVFKS